MKTQSGSDGLVRKVVLKYKLPNEKTFRLVDRPIHDIAVVVPVEEQQPKKGLNPNADPFSPRSPEC